jgi:hypothetical protein
MSLLQLEDSVVHVKPFMSSAKAGSTTVCTLEWDQKFLIKILREKSEMSAQLRNVLTNSVMRKLLDIDVTNSRSKYITLLRAFAVDGVIDKLEKEVLLQYKVNHNIDAATHARGLAILGWTEEEFKRGRKERTMVTSLKSLQRKMEGMMERHLQEDVDEIIQNLRKEQGGL